jgi:hypothetical protein
LKDWIQFNGLFTNEMHVHSRVHANRNLDMLEC